jgi:hypothetical protein
MSIGRLPESAVQMNSRMKKQTSWLVTAFAFELRLSAATQADPANPASAPGGHGVHHMPGGQK